jgi:Carboxypeptidase regulatory-like domain
MRSRSLLLVPLLTLASVAQNNSAKSATGTVTGHVYCADTNAPARMARVRLESVKDDASDHERGNPRTSSDMPVGGIVQTALDGSFMIPNVPPGRYYVIATLTGYLSPRSGDDDEDESRPPAPAGKPPVTTSKVDVQSDQTASIDIRLKRGAAVSGTIRFDDGSPAVGIHVGPVYMSQTKSSASDDFGVAGDVVTNDLGHYRISGMRGGIYCVEALLSHLDLVPTANHDSPFSDMMRSVLVVYSGDATRKNAAASFTLTSGEERTGEDITIPLNKLHTVSGVVTAVRDGHPINAGNLVLMSPEDKELVADAEIASDGTFQIEAVPEGSYILRIRGAHDTMKGAGEQTTRQYGNLEQPLKIESDIPNLALAVPDMKPAARASQ